MLLNNKWIQIASFVAFTTCIADFNNRYDVGSQGQEDKLIEPIEVGQVFSPYENNRVEKILSNFSKYDIPIEEKKVESKNTVSKPNPRLSEEFQNKQKGALSQLFIGDYSYRPIGVFDSQEKFALLEQRHLTNRKTKRIKIVEGQQIENYSVIAIELNSIKIAADKREVSLRLFEIKPKAKKK